MKRDGLRGPNRDAGFALVSLLVVLLILGGLVGVVLMAQSGTPGSKPSIAVPHLPSMGASPANAGPDITAAAVEACKASFRAANDAMEAYEALHGHPPQNVSDIQSMLKDPLNGVGFQVTVSQAGQVEIATAGHPASVGDTNCAFA